jgi:hypothetical protein
MKAYIVISNDTDRSIYGVFRTKKSAEKHIDALLQELKIQFEDYLNHPYRKALKSQMEGNNYRIFSEGALKEWHILNPGKEMKFPTYSSSHPHANSWDYVKQYVKDNIKPKFIIEKY